MASGDVTFGWITQPAFFDTPAGYDARDISLSRQIIAANEKHIEMVRSHFDTIWVEDHMNWLEKAHLECFTNLAWLAGRHEGFRYGSLVAGQAFRNPSLLAKMASNLQLLTNGKFILGIGAGNNPGEHYEYGFRFAPNGERIEQLGEAVDVVRALWTQSPANYEGKHYQVHNAFDSPRPEPPPPVLIGGGGEKKMLRLVAEKADWWCLDVAPADLYAHKSRVLDEHLNAIGRDKGAVLRSYVGWVSVKPNSADAVRWPQLHIIAGDPDEVTCEFERFIELGVKHFMLRFMDYPSTGDLELFLEKVLPRIQP